MNVLLLCTAMVFVWSNLSDGEPHFTLSQVAVNDLVMVFAFAPIVGPRRLKSPLAVPDGANFLPCNVWHRGPG